MIQARNIDFTTFGNEWGKTTSDVTVTTSLTTLVSLNLTVSGTYMLIGRTRIFQSKNEGGQYDISVGGISNSNVITSNGWADSLEGMSYITITEPTTVDFKIRVSSGTATANNAFFCAIRIG